MSVQPDFEKVAESVREALIKRLAADGDGKRFALVLLRALARDDRVADLLFDRPGG